MFGRRGVGDTTPSRCPSIIVRQSSLDDGGDRYALAQDLVNFVNHALRDAMFRRDDLLGAAGNAVETAVWLCGTDVLEARRTAVERTSQGFKAGGFYVLRAPDVAMIVDAGDVGMRGIGLAW